MVFRWRRPAEIFITEIFVTTRNRIPATTNPSAMIANISTGISEVEVVVPVGLLVDGPPREVLLASSATKVSAVGRMDSVRVSLGGAVGS
jgi:hypothetical protein